MSEDVSKFLLQVKELGDRRVEEDEARSRELEEKILQDRKERQARRAERARSISPQKSSPASTPPPPSTQASERRNLESSPVLEPPTSPQTSRDFRRSASMDEQAPFSASASKENESPFDADNKGSSGAVSPTRSNSTARGLSWQRRPNSQASNGSRNRPLSVVAAENAARSSTTLSEPTSTTEAVSRDQIAQALSSKDPSWFRQTADRGATSGAYRKSQVEDDERMDMSSMRAQLPGMSRGPSTEPTKEDSASNPNSPGLRQSLGSPLSLTSSQRLDPPRSDSQLETETTRERQSITSPPLGRTSPTRADRPVSPTKGMGGFVQSAMMKRSDSVNKRWSVQSPGLQRADSVASNRNSYDPTNRTMGGAKSRPSSLIRETSVEANSRPSSSQGKTEVQAEESISRKISNSLKLDTSKPDPEPQEQDKEMASPPQSPSKTMDPRRWSPTKSSWLESALNKPESPKPKPTPPPSNQPSWMAELAKAKAQKAANPNVDIPKTPTVSHKPEVSIGGLTRSSAPGIATKPVQLGANTGPPTPNLNTNRTEYGSTAGAGAEKASAINRSSTNTPFTSVKPKPETPPKKDFRANLKPRPGPSTSGEAESEDFKNVFGKLRKTTTQNYVAPDELKNNILRGKAGLNLTGGPKKTERKDEFKEAILAKKKEFQKAQVEGKGVARSSSTASDNPVPEGLAKALSIGRTNTTKRDSANSLTTSSADQTKRSSTVSRQDSTPLATPTFSERSSSHEKDDPVPDSNSSEPRRPSIGVKRESAQDVPVARLADNSSPIAALSNETSAPGRLQGKVGGGALANRFNPALAGLLARGPPPMASGFPKNAGGSSGPSSTDGGNDGKSDSGPKLTHMTKNRARGPKRKAPTSVAVSASTTTSESIAAPHQEAQEKSPSPRAGPLTPELEKKAAPATAPKPQIVSLLDSSKKIYDNSPRPKPQPISFIDDSKNAVQESSSATPARAHSPVKAHVRSQSRVFEQVAAFAAQKSPSSPTKAQELEQTGSQPSSPRKLNMKRMSKFFDEAGQPAEKSPEREVLKDLQPPVADMKPKPLSKPSSPEPQKLEVRSPPASFTRPVGDMKPLSPKREPTQETVDSEPTVSVKSGTAMFGGRALPSIPPTGSMTPAKPRPTPLEPLSPPSSVPKTAPLAASPVRSPTKQRAEVTNVITEFFGSNRPKRDYRVDSAEILMQRPNLSAPKIRTLDAQLFQFAADGKKVPVPAHHEKVLFEREMYLCSHTFNDVAGKKVSEVYFWAGDEVPTSVVEDAAIFVTREARAVGGKLIKLRQNKETPEFISALGGVVTTRRGSSNKYDSLAPHMLCGRRYYGNVVFDEVDFTPSALCSGFPYLITSSGRCYLWKGKGSGVDELSCARLIGMDYALSGEMEEVEDGRESASFWDLFSGGSKSGSADHWRLKPNYDKYCSRLFYSDAASKQQIVEISPFAQTDLQPTGIYVLDAFFELYIVVGSRAQPQYASFHNALEFAQEYAIIAAGMEDRPFVPISTVVLEGIPKDLKSVFRKWRDADSPTITNAPGNGMGLRRGRSLRIMPLNQALQALSE